LEPAEIREPGRLRRLAIDLGPLRRYPAFRRLFIGQTVSTFGSEIAAVAAPFQLYQLTHSTLQVGLLSLCELFPLLTLTIVGGAIADAVDRRRLLFATEFLLALVAGGFAVNASLAEPRVWALYVLVTLAMSIFSLGVAGMSSVIPRLVEPHELAAANAIENVYGSTTNVAGPALGGVLIAVLGLRGAYLLDAATFAASLWSVWRLPPLPPAHDAGRPSLRTIAEGFRFVRQKNVLLGMFLVDSNAMVFGMPRALFPALAINRFGGGAGILGLMYAAPYAGAFVSSVLSGWIAHVRRQGLIVAVAAALWGVAIAGFGFAESLWLALLLLAAAGAADNVSAVLRGTILWTVTPDPLRGRVSGIEFAQVAATPAIGNVEAGLVASLTSLRLSIVSGGLACVVGTVLIALAVPALTRYDARAPGRALRPQGPRGRA
jgi:MFS family permease